VRDKPFKRGYTFVSKNQNRAILDGIIRIGYTYQKECSMETKTVIYSLIVLALMGCATKPTVINDTMMKPILDSEFPNIRASIAERSSVAVWRCLDDRFGGSPVTVISDWTQGYLEQLLVNSKKFKIVTRSNLKKIFSEQEFQMSGHVDDATMVSIAKIIGAKYMIMPTITRYNTIKLQVLNVETGEITYTSNKTIQKNLSK
jgi:hypothetical protein